MRTYAGGVAWAEGQRLHPTANWSGKCQAFARQCVGAAAWAPTARQAFYEKIPASHRHTSSAPAGSLLYYGSHDPGHVVFVVANGYCYSNDVRRRGKIDRVPVSEVEDWLGRSYPRLGWIDQTPSGKIDLAPTAARCSLSKVQAASKLDPPAPQGHVTYPADTILVERTLVKLGFLASRWVDGSFGSLTVDAYAKFQRSIKAPVTTGRPQLGDLKVLGAHGGFVVVA